MVAFFTAYMHIYMDYIDVYIYIYGTCGSDFRNALNLARGKEWA